MRVRSGHRYTWWFRAWRSKNPLLRAAGPAEWSSRLGAGLLCLVLALSVPAAAMITWHATGAQAAYPDDVHTVEATVTAPSDSDVPAPAPMTHYTQTVQWTWHGEQRTGQLDTTGAPAHGDVQKVRVDEHGELLSSQFSMGRAVTLVVLVTIASAITALVLALVGFRLRARWSLHRHAQSWEQEWEQVQPVWTGRSHPS